MAQWNQWNEWFKSEFYNEKQFQALEHVKTHGFEGWERVQLFVGSQSGKAKTVFYEYLLSRFE